VEADQEQINLTRFELTLPEKRQFFLEGQEQFNQRFRTFYSRRIQDIAAGGKLLGKQGPWTMVLLSAQSKPIGGGGRANYTVARAQRDLPGRSTLAIMGANRRLDGKDQGSVSSDTNSARLCRGQRNSSGSRKVFETGMPVSISVTTHASTIQSKQASISVATSIRISYCGRPRRAPSSPPGFRPSIRCSARNPIPILACRAHGFTSFEPTSSSRRIYSC